MDVIWASFATNSTSRHRCKRNVVLSVVRRWVSSEPDPQATRNRDVGTCTISLKTKSPWCWKFHGDPIAQPLQTLDYFLSMMYFCPVVLRTSCPQSFSGAHKVRREQGPRPTLPRTSLLQAQSFSSDIRPKATTARSRPNTSKRQGRKSWAWNLGGNMTSADPLDKCTYVTTNLELLKRHLKIWSLISSFQAQLSQSRQLPASKADINNKFLTTWPRYTFSLVKTVLRKEQHKCTIPLYEFCFAFRTGKTVPRREYHKVERVFKGNI